VQIVTGDTKVVERGACDKLFITTAGIGVIRKSVELGVGRARPGDVVLVSGPIGDHGATILAARGDLHLDTELRSDCAALHGVVATLLAAAPHTRCLRDATRGGVATVLNEIALASGCSVEIVERNLPLRPAVRGVCELLGLDPLYLANEGTLVGILPETEVDGALAALRGHPLGREAVVIGEITRGPAGQVVMHTALGGRRIVDMPFAEQLPRIC
jgi:hydrogenase expression/formation protein HypE